MNYTVLVLCYVMMGCAELMFLETSALTGENVEEAFVQCARKILNKIESGNCLQLSSAASHSSVKYNCMFT